MTPWTTLDRVALPDGGGEISLHQRGDEFSIRVDGLELMNSLAHTSEETLAALACAKIANHRKPCVLIGGLGMGFTLAAALRQLGPAARVVIAELLPAVIAWNRTHLAALSSHALEDARVTVYEADVAAILSQARGTYDAVMLDVDNGPEGLVCKGNDRLYSREGLRASFAALKPSGVLAVWSVAPDKGFTKRLCKTGFEVDEVRVRSKGRHGSSRHTIWIAEKKTLRN
jgi:spermidine synthase